MASVSESDVRRRWRGYDRDSAHHDALHGSEPPSPALERALLERSAAGRKAAEELPDLEARFEELRARIEELRAMARDGRSARDELVSRNLRLAAAIAARYQGYGVPLDDLISQANIGLCVAADRFDPSRTTRFSTYVWPWVKRYVMAALPEASGVRIPLNVYTAALKPEKADAKMQRYIDAANAARRVERIHDWDAADSESDPAEAIEDAVDAEAIEGLLERLPGVWREIVVRRFGIGVEPETLEAIGVTLGISKERVRQLETKAMERLRKLTGAA